jgi:hypothetical protein
MTEPRDFEELQREWDERARSAQATAAQAFGRLLRRAEDSDTGQARRIAQFLAATFDSAAFRWDPLDLRAVDVEISDDMLACLDALRWGKADLWKLVPDGDIRVVAMCQAWGLQPAR